MLRIQVAWILHSVLGRGTAVLFDFLFIKKNRLSEKSQLGK